MLVSMILSEAERAQFEDLKKDPDDKILFMSATPGSAITDPNDPKQRALVLAEMRKGLQQLKDGTATPIDNIDGEDFVQHSIDGFLNDK